MEHYTLDNDIQRKLWVNGLIREFYGDMYGTEFNTWFHNDTGSILRIDRDMSVHYCSNVVLKNGYLGYKEKTVGLGNITDIYLNYTVGIILLILETNLLLIDISIRISPKFYLKRDIQDDFRIDDFIQETLFDKIVHTGFDGAPSPVICKIGGGNGDNCRGCLKEYVMKSEQGKEFMETVSQIGADKLPSKSIKFSGKQN